MANENITKQDLNKVEENLARMIQKGFDENTKEHQIFLNKFEKIDERFDKNTKEHQIFFNKFEKIDARFEHMDTRLGTIETDLKEIKERLPKPDEIEDLKARMDLTEKKVGIVS